MPESLSGARLCPGPGLTFERTFYFNSLFPLAVLCVRSKRSERVFQKNQNRKDAKKNRLLSVIGVAASRWCGWIDTLGHRVYEISGLSPGISFR